MARIAINGLGRIGKLVLRALVEEGTPGEVVLVNDPAGDPAQHAMLLEFDTVHGRWPASFGHTGESLTVNGREMRFTQGARIQELPLHELGVDLVLDCTGVFKTVAKTRPYFEAGVGKVIVSAPITDPGALNFVYGVNHDGYDSARHHLITAASCTTNCLAPMVKVLHDGIGIRHGSITTIHDVTNTQTMVDRPAKDARRARSGLNSLIPTTTGSATAIAAIFPELEGRLDGHAVRVPLLNASLTDAVFELARETTAEEINALYRAAAAQGPLRGILGFEDRPLVSADYVNDPRSAIIDGPSTMVVAGTQAKVFGWYDNEWAYAWRMADLARMVAERMA